MLLAYTTPRYESQIKGDYYNLSLKNKALLKKDYQQNIKCQVTKGKDSARRTRQRKYRSKINRRLLHKICKWSMTTQTAYCLPICMGKIQFIFLSF